jgi:hypothetical protein
MSSQWVKMTLRIAAAILVVFAIWTLAFGGVSFRSEKQISSDAYVISHTVVMAHRPIIVALLGAALFGTSFLIRARRV